MIREKLDIGQAKRAVSHGFIVTRDAREWENLRWTPEGLINTTISDQPTGICLTHDDVFANDWRIIGGQQNHHLLGPQTPETKERERLIVALRGESPPVSYRVIGNRLGISGERVKQIYYKATTPADRRGW